TLPPGAPPVYGYEAKWVWDRPEAPLAIFQCPARVAGGMYREIERTALDAYHALGCRDWCRVDVRIDRFGVPNVLELNPLPEDIRGVMKAVDEIGAIFGAMGAGHEVRKVPVRHDMRWFQVARRADLVFNLCEGVHGKSEWEEHVVGTLEFAGVPLTGASLWT